MLEKKLGSGAVLAALEAAGVRFVLIGGVALVAHGLETVTQDIDICYDRDVANLAALTSALAPFHPTLRGAPPDLPFVFDVRTLNVASWTDDSRRLD